MIHVDTDAQTLNLYEKGVLLVSYPCSTAKMGLGEQCNTDKTPRGWHIVRAKIGADQAIHTVFVGRRPTGEIYTPALGLLHPDRDWILSRILWLSGTQKGFNRLGDVDTMRRFIYIHGCPDEISLTRPLSHGCVRMHNEAVIDLFERTPHYCPVFVGTKAQFEEGNTHG